MEPNSSEIPAPREHLRDELKNGKLCAIMVTYNPDAALERNIRAMLPQVDKLIIVDNGSALPIRAHIETIASSCAVQVIWNKENLGLATALNIGIRSAFVSDNFAWIATFDQDSRVAAGFRDAMLQAYLACPYRQSVGIIGPHHVELTENSTAGLSHHEEHDRFREITAVMQSGTFLSTKALRSYGLFDDSFFIDYVDFELCLRVRKNGLRIIEAPMLSSPTGSGIPPGITVSEELSRSAITALYAATMLRETGSVSTSGTCFLTLPGFATTSGYGPKSLLSWYSLRRIERRNWLTSPEADGTRFADAAACIHDRIASNVNELLLRWSRRR